MGVRTVPKVYIDTSFLENGKHIPRGAKTASYILMHILFKTHETRLCQRLQSTPLGGCIWSLSHGAETCPKRPGGGINTQSWRSTMGPFCDSIESFPYTGFLSC